jgi:hypothetical protein
MKRLALVLGLVSYAAAGGWMGSRMWDWVLNFDPGFVFSQPAVPTGSPSSSGVTILLIDGLRIDASRRMPTLNALRAQGADLEAQVGTPSFSRPGRATIAVGAPPDIHGVTTNRQKRAIPLDNIIRRVGAIQGHCRIAGSKIWSGLFGADIDRCGVYREGEAKEGPGAFARQVGAVRSAQEAGIAFVLEQKAMLRIADIISTDFAAHEYGGTSPEYIAEVGRADALLAGLLKGLDLTRETLVVVADHGHRELGGHGGEEAEVLAIPVVLAGAGIKPGTRAKVEQADLAPTVAALLGTALPAAASGRPLIEILADESRRPFLENAAAQQRANFEKGVGLRLGEEAVRFGEADWRTLRLRHRGAEKESKAPLLAFLPVLLAAFTLTAVHFAGVSRIGVGAGVVASLIALLGPVGSRIPALSFSAINYDEMLIPFFENVLALAAVMAVIAAVSGVVAARIFPRTTTTGTEVDLVGSIGVIGSAVLGISVIVYWHTFDLLSPLTLPGPGRLVEAFCLVLSLVSVATTSLVMMAALWVIEAAGRRRG